MTIDYPTLIPEIPDDEQATPTRWRERLLLLIAAAFALVGFTALTLLNPSRSVAHLLTFGAWCLAAGGGHYALNRWLAGRDQLLFPLVMFLSGWGLVAIERLAPRFADRQALWLLLSVAAMVAVAAWPRSIHWLREYRYLWLLFGLLLLISTIILGRNPSGSPLDPPLWLGFSGVFFQPSELLKVILIAFLASYLAEQYPALRAEGLVTRPGLLALSPRVFGPVVLMSMLSVVILVWQRDLGTAALFFIVFLLLLYVASGYTPVLFGGGVLVLLAGIAAYTQFPVVQLRVDIWLNPWPQAADDAYQIVQSLQAFAAGGIWGEGVGQGSPWAIPVVHSDFVFAAVAEEWGLLGVTVVLVCIGVFVLRGFLLAARYQGRPFQALLSLGIVGLIGVQSILIMGGVIRLLPLTGVTLPFMSYGGSSLLMSFIMVGLLLRLSADVEEVA